MEDPLFSWVNHLWRCYFPQLLLVYWRVSSFFPSISHYISWYSHENTLVFMVKSCRSPSFQWLNPVFFHVAPALAVVVYLAEWDKTNRRNEWASSGIFIGTEVHIIIVLVILYNYIDISIDLMVIRTYIYGIIYNIIEPRRFHDIYIWNYIYIYIYIICIYCIYGCVWKREFTPKTTWLVRKMMVNHWIWQRPIEPSIADQNDLFPPIYPVN